MTGCPLRLCVFSCTPVGEKFGTYLWRDIPQDGQDGQDGQEGQDGQDGQELLQLICFISGLLGSGTKFVCGLVTVSLEF